MARIRTIKPSFFTSLTITALSFRCRLGFVGLWTHVDDAGRCVYEPRLIKAAIYPLDDAVSVADVAADVATMIAANLVTLYEVGDRKYLQINGFAEHQHINRARKSDLPGPDAGVLTEASVNPHGGLTDVWGQEGKGMEGKGKGVEKRAATPRGGWVDEAVQLWTREIGVESHGRMGKALAPAVKVFGAPAVLAAIPKFAGWRRDKMHEFDGKVPGLQYFASNLRSHIPRNLLPQEDAA